MEHGFNEISYNFDEVECFMDTIALHLELIYKE